MNTTDMCLELYYQLKSTARFNTPVIEVIAIDEQRNPLHLASSTGANRTSWDRMFAELPSGLHQIVIEGRRSNTSFCGMSVDDVVVQPCHLFGQLYSYIHMHMLNHMKKTAITTVNNLAVYSAF